MCFLERSWSYTCTRLEYERVLWAVVLMTHKQALVLTQHISILTSLCLCALPLLKKLGCLQAMLLFTSRSCMLHTLPGLYHHVVDHLAAPKSEAPQVSYVFV